jgi:thiamine biosynthesis lipoprotein
VMGMAVSIDIRSRGDSPRAVSDVVTWLHHVDETFSTYRDASPISAMGRGELSLADASEEIRSVLRACAQLTEVSDGAFDPFAVPAPNGTIFDPSGYVKGWAVEEAAALLERRGCTDFCINAGGDIALRGNVAPGDPWQIGIRHPEVTDEVALVIQGSGRLAVATSATYERGAHLIDPRTGQPTTEIASATVVGPDLALADGYATIVFVLGAGGLTWLAERTRYEGYVIDHDGMTRWTDGFARFRSASAEQQ